MEDSYNGDVNKDSGPPPYTQPQAAQPPPPPPPATQTVVVTTTSTVPMVTFGPDPVTMTCPSCQNNITTITATQSGMLVIILVLLILFIFQLWCGCCLIPLCISGLKDVCHTCPVCKCQLGVFKRL